MSAALRAELLKVRTTTTTVGLFAGLLGVIVFAEVLHALGLPAADLGHADQQVRILQPAESLDILFAAIFGAVSFTAELRHGTIRPTLLAEPRRARVLMSKMGAAMIVGAGFGLLGGAAALATVVVGLRSRGVPIQYDVQDYLLATLGLAAAATLWAAVGVGVSAITRNQVATLVGLCAWLLLLENLVVGNLPDLGIGRFLPGTVALAVSGQELDDRVLAPGVALLLLIGYAIVAAAAGSGLFQRRDAG